MPQKIAVGLVSRTFFNMPLWAAMENGFFAAEGIEVAPTILGSASQVPPLLDGSLQVVIGSPESAMQNAAAGGPLRLIAGNAGKLVHSLIARAPFKRIEDLRGATIGILNMKEGTFFHIKTMLAAHGLNFPADYKVTETGGVPPRHKALLEGTIDAGLQSVPWNFVAEDAGMNNLGNVIDYVPDWQFVSDQRQCRMGRRQSRSAGALPADTAARHRMALCQPRGGIRDRRARNAGAARSCAAGVGPFHRHQCAHPRHVGQHPGASSRSSRRCGNPGTCRMERRPIPPSTSTAAICRRPAQG